MEPLIIIRGPLGIGKTTVAKRMQTLCHGEYIAMDEVLLRLGLDRVEGECIPLENFLNADDEILPLIQKHREGGRAVIVDGNFYHEAHIDHLLSNAPPPHALFSLKAPLEVCKQRDRMRKQPYGEDATEAVFNLVSRFDRGIPIDANRNPETVVSEMFSRL